MSAGGNLAAALTLKCRQEGGPRLAFQLLEVPVLDLTRWLSVGASDPDPHHAEQLVAAVRALPAGRGGGRVASWPRRCARTDLSGLPPAYVMTAELDPLRRDGERYAARLAAAGVPATVSVEPRRHPRGLVPHPGLAAGPRVAGGRRPRGPPGARERADDRAVGGQSHRAGEGIAQ